MKEPQLIDGPGGVRSAEGGLFESLAPADLRHVELERERAQSRITELERDVSDVRTKLDAAKREVQTVRTELQRFTRSASGAAKPTHASLEPPASAAERLQRGSDRAAEGVVQAPVQTSAPRLLDDEAEEEELLAVWSTMATPSIPRTTSSHADDGTPSLEELHRRMHEETEEETVARLMRGFAGV